MFVLDINLPVSPPPPSSSHGHVGGPRPQCSKVFMKIKLGAVRAGSLDQPRWALRRNAAERRAEGLTCWECMRTGRRSESTLGGDSSIFSVCPEKLCTKSVEVTAASCARGAPVAKPSAHLPPPPPPSRIYPAIQRCVHNPDSCCVIRWSIIMKKGTLNFLGRKNHSLFDTNVKMKEMGEYAAPHGPRKPNGELQVLANTGE